MGKLLLIMGDIAAGKSTFANILSKRYDTNIFFKDSIKEVLGDAIGFQNREENKKLSKAAEELLFFIFSEFGKLNKNLILESNFHTAQIERLHKLAHENNYEILTLVLQGDVEILHRRYLNRINNENRHPVHLSKTLDNFDDFKKCADYLRKAEIIGNSIYISADDFSYQTDESILGKIDEFVKGVIGGDNTCIL